MSGGTYNNQGGANQGSTGGKSSAGQQPQIPFYMGNGIFREGGTDAEYAAQRNFDYAGAGMGDQSLDMYGQPSQMPNMGGQQPGNPLQGTPAMGRSYGIDPQSKAMMDAWIDSERLPAAATGTPAMGGQQPGYPLNDPYGIFQVSGGLRVPPPWQGESPPADYPNYIDTMPSPDVNPSPVTNPPATVTTPRPNPMPPAGPGTKTIRSSPFAGNIKTTPRPVAQPARQPARPPQPRPMTRPSVQPPLLPSRPQLRRR